MTRSLGSVVGRVIRRTDNAVNRREIDDAAATCAAQMRYGVLCAQEDAAHVYFQNVLPLLDRDLMSRFAHAGNAGIVDHDIDLAEGIGNLTEYLLNRRLIRDVEMPKARIAAGAVDVFGNHPAVIVKDVGDRNRRTFSRQRLAGGRSDSV